MLPTMRCPIFINCRDRVSCLSALVDWLERAGHEEIILIDNASTYPPLLEYYERSPHSVMRMDENLGHTALWQTGLVEKLCGPEGYYVYSDPDVVPIEECPPDAVDFFRDVLETYPDLAKVGFGLRIDDLPDHYALKDRVVRWENQYWTKSIEPGLFDAPIDTTFALHRGVKSHQYHDAVRTGYPYIARHTAWYVDSENLGEEEEYYRSHARADVTNWNAPALPEDLERKLAELPVSEPIGLQDQPGLLLRAWRRESKTRDELEFTPWAEPGWASWNAMSPEVDVCEFAGWLVRMLRPRVVIETGVGQGYLTRRIAENLHGAHLLCFEADPVVRAELRKLPFFDDMNHECRDSASPSEDDFAHADISILDSDFPVRFDEVRRWWESAGDGAVALFHDCGNGHGPETPHAALASFIQALGITGVFLKNPRGSFLAVKAGGAGSGGATERELALSDELERIKQSRSYRYTAPARWLRSQVAQVRNGKSR
jgi:hypothetical protein